MIYPDHLGTNSHTGHCDTKGRMAEKVKEVALEESNRLKALTGDAAKSGAYLYPIRVRIGDNGHEDV